jgi:uncharacterized membrane protein
MASSSEQQIARLTQRVYQLEQKLNELQRALDASSRVGTTTPAVAVAPTVPASPPAATVQHTPIPTTIPPPVAWERRDEADVLGAWFARIGAIVLLIGLGFAFKYAVDRGIIGPTARVTLGLAAALGLVIAAEWAVKRSWAAWAQAVAGAGVALSYLSILAAVQLYALIDPALAFACLVVITVGAGFLAIRHDSIVLALLATAGGYLNAVILTTEQPRPLGVFTYLLALEAGVLGLAFLRGWRVLDGTTLLGTVIVFGLTAGDVDFGTLLGFSTVYLLMFVALPVVRAFRRAIGIEDLALVALGLFVYFAYVAVLLGDNGFEGKQGSLALVMGLAVAALSFGMRTRSEHLSTGLLFMGIAFGVLFVPLQFNEEAISAAWAVEGALLVWAGSYAPLRRLRTFGVILLGVSVFALLSLYNRLVPDRLLVSSEAIVFVIEIAALATVAWLLRHNPEPLPRESAAVAVLAAIAVAIVWVSVEVTAQLDRSGATDQAVQFSLSAVGGSFATALLAFGVRLRMRWIRMAGVSVFGIVLAKLALADLWKLSTSYRFMAFAGLGVILLACSLGFYRFRDHLVGPDEPVTDSPSLPPTSTRM